MRIWQKIHSAIQVVYSLGQKCEKATQGHLKAGREFMDYSDLFATLKSKFGEDWEPDADDHTSRERLRKILLALQERCVDVADKFTAMAEGIEHCLIDIQDRKVTKPD